MKEYKTWILTKSYAAEQFNDAIEGTINLMCSDGEFPENIDQGDFADTIKIDRYHSLLTDEYMIDCAKSYVAMFEDALMDDCCDHIYDQEHCNIWIPRVRVFIKERLEQLAEAEKELNERLFNQGE